MTLKLKPTVDILATVAARPNAPYCVGFAAESQDVERLGEEKRRRKKLPLLIANLAQEALGSDVNQVTLLDDAGAHPLPQDGEGGVGKAVGGGDLAAAGPLIARKEAPCPPRSPRKAPHDPDPGPARRLRSQA